MGRNLVLVEHEAQVEDVLQRSWTDELTWAAVGPGAMFELQQREIPFVIPEDYYQPEEIENLGAESRSRLKKLCNIIDGLLRQEIPEVKELDLTPTLFYFHALTSVMDMLAARTFQIKRLISATQPQVVSVHTSPSYPFASYDIQFDNRESLYGRLLSLKGWNVEVNLLPQVALPQDTLRRSWKAIATKHIENLYSSSEFFYNLAMTLRHVGWRNLKQLTRKGAPIVCILGGYDWIYLLNDLSRNGVKPVFLLRKLNWPRVDIVGREVQKRLTKELEQDSVFSNLFVWEGIDIYPLMEKTIAYLVGDNVKQSIDAHKLASKVFREKRVSALLTSPRTKAVWHAVCLAAQQSNIPVFNWQHGSAGYYNHHTIEYFDLLTTDVYLAYGNGVVQFLEAKNKDSQVTIKAVGCASLDRLKKAQDRSTPSCNLIRQLPRYKKEGGKICLYATTNYFQNHWYASYSPPPSDNLLCKTQLMIVKELSKYPNLRLVIKLHPNLDYRTPPWISQFARENTLLDVVRDECAFSHLSWYSGLIIIDWPSTVLLQALTTDKPIFVVLKHLHLLPEARQKLEYRAICANEPQALIESVRNYLSTGNYHADVSDNTFLKTYGTHLDDGCSSQRAVEEVLKAVPWR